MPDLGAVSVNSSLGVTQQGSNLVRGVDAEPDQRIDAQFRSQGALHFRDYAVALGKQPVHLLHEVGED